MADKASKVAAVMSTSAAIAAALALSKQVKAATPGGDINIPAEMWDLIIAMAEDLDEARAALQSLSINVQGWPPNTEGITALRVAVAVTGTRLPYIAIPSGMSLVIKAWALNPGWLQVGASPAGCTNINQSFPLIPNEIVGYQIQNAEELYIAGTVAGCFACLTVEQRRGV
jgi:hypothetical protein